MDELTSVRDLLTEPEPSHEVIAAGRARLLAAADPFSGFSDSFEPSGPPAPGSPGDRMIRQARRGRRTAWWTALGVGLAGTAAAAALVIASSTAVHPPAPLTRLPVPDTSATARQVLLAAATAAAKAPTKGAYWVTRAISGSQRVEPGARYLIQQSRSTEMWLSRTRDRKSWRINQYLGAKPATPKDEAAWRKNGSPARWLFEDGALTGGYIPPDSRIESAPGEREASWLRGKWIGSAGHLTKGLITWAEVRAIPDTPEKLKAYLSERSGAYAAKWPGSRKEGEADPWVLQDCMEIITSLPVSPETRAAAYQLLASLPEMKSEGEVVDHLGRVGQAISYPVDTSTPQGENKVYGRNRLVIDVASGLPLSREMDGLDRLADGRTYKVASFTAYEQIGWTNDLPDLPARRN
ncbi:CU044_5270 family protein [Streptosporangium sp. NBC_01469]|uniref:CU044_5270 family protein n=1 Tax=Streptosporangium sp. NBC_01469 TaxID=2903898 RepID=UPI002E29D554|nr:CU044_5270 family protein [Streptosporangium sp. NBC_01469]